MNKIAAVKHPKSRSEDSYDAIIVGGGMGGVSAAAMLSKAGRKILLVEKEPRLGGMTAPLVHGQYQFDFGARLLMSCNADGPYGPGIIHSFLERLGVRNQVEFIQVQPFAHIHFPDAKFQIWSGREQYIEGVRRVAPHGLEELPALLELCSRIYRGSRNFTNNGKPWTPWRALVEMPEFFRYANTTVETMLARYVSDRHARTVVGAMWPYIGIPPKEASFFAWANMMATYIEEGGYFCRGGLHKLVEAISMAIILAGGEILSGTTVRRVLVKNRAVTGVELAGGQRYFAPVVIANIDPRQVFGEMMDPTESPAGYRRRLDWLTPSDKGVSISFVTDLDLPSMDFAFENLIFDSWNEDQVERNPFKGQVGFTSLVITTAIDHSLAPTGQHMVSVFAGLPIEAPLGPIDLRRYGEVVMSMVFRLIPKLDGHLLLANQDSVVEGYLTQPFGSIYGWKASPWQATLRRPNLQTPVRGLILAGQWTRPIQGVMSAILSGSEAARIVLAGL